MNALMVITVLLLCGCQTLPKGAGDHKAGSVQEAVSVLGPVRESFNIRDTGVKYCPVDGKRFSSRLDRCLEHETKLIPVE